MPAAPPRRGNITLGPGPPSAAQVVYERAVAAFPVTHYLWAQYARYLEAHLKINSGRGGGEGALRAGGVKTRLNPGRHGGCLPSGEQPQAESMRVRHARSRVAHAGAHRQWRAGLHLGLPRWPPMRHRCRTQLLLASCCQGSATERRNPSFPCVHALPHAVINSVYARAVRNCPWVGQLWGRALRALERSCAPEEEHAAMYDKALAAGLQVRRGRGPDACSLACLQQLSVRRPQSPAPPASGPIFILSLLTTH